MANEGNITPPTPFRIPIVDNNGFVTDPWGRWFRQIFVRTGGSSASNNNEQITASIGALNTITSTHSTQISSLREDVDGILQGRIL